MLEGPLTEKYRKILERIASISPDSESNLGVGNVEDSTPPHMPSFQNINKFMLNFSSPCVDNLRSLTGELSKTDELYGNSTINLSDDEMINQIAQDCEETSLFSEKIILNDVVKRLDSLTQQFEKHRAESSIVLTELINVREIRKASTDTDQLVQENILLKEQNRALESDLAGLRSALTELNGKLTATENEKASLLTASRLLNDGQATITSPTKKNEVNYACRTQNLWVTARSKTSTQRDHHIVNLNNKYSTLCVEDENETENATDVMNNQTIASPRQDICQRNCQVTESIAAGDVQSTSSANWSQRQTQRLLLPNVSGRDATCPKDNNDQQSKRPSHRSKITIVGDSMLKYLNPTKLRQNLRKIVLVRTFPGAKVMDMKHYVQPTLSTSPETLVLHVGTNDLSQKSVQEVLQDLTSLGQSICTDSPTTKLVISGIIN